MPEKKANSNVIKLINSLVEIAYDEAMAEQNTVAPEHRSEELFIESAIVHMEARLAGTFGKEIAEHLATDILNKLEEKAEPDHDAAAKDSEL